MRRALRFLWAGLSLLIVGGPGAAPAWAGGEIEGTGFRARAPAGFRETQSQDEDGVSSRSLKRRVESGELVLTLTSVACRDRQTAELEQQLGEVLDGLTGLFENAGQETERRPVQVTGADGAFEVVVKGERGTLRLVTARRGDRLLTAELHAPPGAEVEAEESWSALLASLRAEEPAFPAGTVLIAALAALTLLTLVLVHRQRVRRAAMAPTFIAPRTESRANPPTSGPETPRVSEVPASAPPVRRVSGGGFSRADDGLPVFTAQDKAAGLSADTALPLPSAPSRPAPAPKPPSRAPNLVPTPPKVPARPPAAPPVLRADSPSGDPASVPPPAPPAAPAPPEKKRFTITRY